MASKKLKFYKLYFYKHIVGSSNRKLLGEGEAKVLLKSFIDKHTKVNADSSVVLRTTSFPGFSDKIYFDILKDDDDYLFATIGQEAQANVQIRNLDNLTATMIERKEDEIFEAYTYFIVDYQRFLVTFVSNQHSPSIKNIQKVFDNLDKSESTKVEGFSQFDIIPKAIVEVDALKSILSAENLHDITIDLATMDAEILGSVFPKRKLYEELVENGIEVDLKITISKPKPAGKRKGPLGKMSNLSRSVTAIADYIRSSKSGTERVKFRTKTGNEILQDFDLFDNNYTYNVPWKIDQKKLIDELNKTQVDNEVELSSTLMRKVNDYTFEKLKDGYEINVDRLIKLARKTEE